MKKPQSILESVYLARLVPTVSEISFGYLIIEIEGEEFKIAVSKKELKKFKDSIKKQFPKSIVGLSPSELISAVVQGETAIKKMFKRKK